MALEVTTLDEFQGAVHPAHSPRNAGGVVGIDFSLTSTGLAFVTNEGVIEDLANLGRKGSRSDGLPERAERIGTLASGILIWIMSNPLPELVVVEAPSYGSSGGSAFDRSGLWWIVVARLHELGVPVAQVAPRTRAKYGTGDGRADKDVVMAHVVETYGDQLPHALPPKSRGGDDQADALLLAAMGARHLGFTIEPFDLPPRNLEAMEAVKWPISV